MSIAQPNINLISSWCHLESITFHKERDEANYLSNWMGTDEEILISRIIFIV